MDYAKAFHLVAKASKESAITKFYDLLRAKDMKKMKLTVSSKFPTQNKWLSMDEYIEFVNFNSRYFRRNKIMKKDDSDMRAKVPFSMK